MIFVYRKFIFTSFFAPRQMGLVRLHEENTRVDEIPFTSENKWMAVKTKKTWAFGNQTEVRLDFKPYLEKRKGNNFSSDTGKKILFSVLEIF